MLLCLALGWPGKGLHNSFSPQETGWLPTLRTEYINPASWLVTPEVWAAGSRQHNAPWGPCFPALDPARGPWGPFAGGAGVVIKAQQSPGVPSGSNMQQSGSKTMATGVRAEPMGNQTHILNANQIQTQTQYVKAAASSLCNKYCKAHLVSFFSFFKSNLTINIPKPCSLHQNRGGSW